MPAPSVTAQGVAPGRYPRIILGLAHHGAGGFAEAKTASRQGCRSLQVVHGMVQFC